MTDCHLLSIEDTSSEDRVERGPADRREGLDCEDLARGEAGLGVMSRESKHSYANMEQSGREEV